MFNYPVINYGLKFYKFKFLDIEEKVTVEAVNGRQAKELLFQFMQQNPKFYKVPVINQSVSHPVTGESTKMIGDMKYVWIGGDKLWMPLWEYKKINKIEDDYDDDEEE